MERLDKFTFRKAFLYLALSIFIAGVAFAIKMHFTKPPDELAGLPKIDRAVARSIAERELVKQFGADVLKQKPFSSLLELGVWKFRGTFHCPEPGACRGGVAEISISAEDGHVIEMSHGK